MSTTIEFSGSERALNVAQKTEVVFERFMAAHGRPFLLERPGGEPVFVNPHAVAFWLENKETISPGRLDSR